MVLPLRGALYQASIYLDGKLSATEFGLHKGWVESSIVADSVEGLAKKLAEYNSNDDLFSSWGKPSILSGKERGKSVELRTSIGAEVPKELELLAISYSKQLATAKPTE